MKILLRQTLSRKCSVCGHNSTDSSEEQLSYLDHNVKFLNSRRPAYRDRISAALTLGWCPICGHNLLDSELEDVAAKVATFYEKQRRSD